MKKTMIKPVLLRDDYELLISLINNRTRASYDRKNVNRLQTELENSQVVKSNSFPINTVRLNSSVSIVDLADKSEFKFQIVLPDRANFASGKISIVSPLGTAMIGYSVGQQFTCPGQAGNKIFLIRKVQNAMP